eukprot:1157474-Pelagomonas_calceolata.AAC.6
MAGAPSDQDAETTSILIWHPPPWQHQSLNAAQCLPSPSAPPPMTPAISLRSLQVPLPPVFQAPPLPPPPAQPPIIPKRIIAGATTPTTRASHARSLSGCKRPPPNPPQPPPRSRSGAQVRSCAVWRSHPSIPYCCCFSAKGCANALRRCSSIPCFLLVHTHMRATTVVPAATVIESPG